MVIALLGAALVALIPFVGQTIQLYSIAASEIPTYPGAERLQVTLSRGPAARIVVRLHTSAKPEQVTAWYNEHWQRRGWSTHHAGPAFIDANKPGRVMFLAVHQPSGEVSVNWYKSYANH